MKKLPEGQFPRPETTLTHATKNTKNAHFHWHLRPMKAPSVIQHQLLHLLLLFCWCLSCGPPLSLLDLWLQRARAQRRGSGNPKAVILATRAFCVGDSASRPFCSLAVVFLWSYLRCCRPSRTFPALPLRASAAA